MTDSTELRERLVKAKESVDRLVETADKYGSYYRTRLEGKSEGIALAISYLDESGEE